MKSMGRRSGRQRPGDLYTFVAEGIYRSEDEIPGGLIDCQAVTTAKRNRPFTGGEEGYKQTDSQSESEPPHPAG